MPELNEPRELAEVLGEASRFDRVIAATGPSTSGEPVVATMAGCLGQWGGVDDILAFVGPEGGWSEAELEMLTGAGAEVVSLGPNVLRIETAAIVLAAAVHAVRV